MHPARLSFLATRHAQRRAVVSRDIRTDGVTLKLECGHEGHGVSHFDYSKTETWNCSECGAEFVRSAPQYAKEFES